VNDRTYEFSSTENTRTADRALAYMLKIKQREMALRELPCFWVPRAVSLVVNSVVSANMHALMEES